MDGDEVLHEIRVFRPAVQVIMLTGYGSVKSAMDSARLDAYAYLGKPADFDELLETTDYANLGIAKENGKVSINDIQGEIPELANEYIEAGITGDDVDIEVLNARLKREGV